MRVAAGIYIKDRITLNDIVSVVKYSKEAQEEPTRSGKVRAMKQVVKALTTRRWFVNLRDLYYIPQILEATKLKTEKRTEIPENIEKSILKTASSIGAKCSKLPFEVMTGMTLDETEIYSLHLLLEKYEQALSMVYAYHSPGEYSKEMNKRLKESQSKVLNFGKIEERSTEQSDESGFVAPREVFALMGNVG